MGWGLGYDDRWKRHIGYAVLAICDHPDCDEEINRGLGYVCGGEPYGGERGCGLYFCEKHLFLHRRLPQLCERCSPRIRKPFPAKPDCARWLWWQAVDPSWQEWRKENREFDAAKHAAAYTPNEWDLAALAASMKKALDGGQA